ncbi:hypothetical protein BKA70DRAFT_1401016 [Coprinopsis sp. MPI-PUGE-AT-0042]|nr:hypothetical protein BKA70DRAFT_1401016 [Coprinopsis sp. MPI-PUGE-AT-0042]
MVLVLLGENMRTPSTATAAIFTGVNIQLFLESYLVISNVCLGRETEVQSKRTPARWTALPHRRAGILGHSLLAADDSGAVRYDSFSMLDYGDAFLVVSMNLRCARIPHVPPLWPGIVGTTAPTFCSTSPGTIRRYGVLDLVPLSRTTRFAPRTSVGELRKATLLLVPPLPISRNNPEMQAFAHSDIDASDGLKPPVKSASRPATSIFAEQYHGFYPFRRVGFNHTASATASEGSPNRAEEEWGSERVDNTGIQVQHCDNRADGDGPTGLIPSVTTAFEVGEPSFANWGRRCFQGGFSLISRSSLDIVRSNTPRFARNVVRLRSRRPFRVLEYRETFIGYRDLYPNRLQQRTRFTLATGDLTVEPTSYTADATPPEAAWSTHVSCVRDRCRNVGEEEGRNTPESRSSASQLRTPARRRQAHDIPSLAGVQYWFVPAISCCSAQAANQTAPGHPAQELRDPTAARRDKGRVEQLPSALPLKSTPQNAARSRGSGVEPTSWLPRSLSFAPTHRSRLRLVPPRLLPGQPTSPTPVPLTATRVTAELFAAPTTATVSLISGTCALRTCTTPAAVRMQQRTFILRMTLELSIPVPTPPSQRSNPHNCSANKFYPSRTKRATRKENLPRMPGKHVFIATVPSNGMILAFRTRTETLTEVQAITRHQMANIMKAIEFTKSGRCFATNSSDRTLRYFVVPTYPDTESSQAEDILETDLEPMHQFNDPTDKGTVDSSTRPNCSLGSLPSPLPFTFFPTLIATQRNPPSPPHIPRQPPHLAWGAFAGGFKEVDENIAYEERQDEFDVEDKQVISERKTKAEEDADIDSIAIVVDGHGHVTARALQGKGATRFLNATHLRCGIDNDECDARLKKVARSTAVPSPCTFGAAIVQTSPVFYTSRNDPEIWKTSFVVRNTFVPRPCLACIARNMFAPHPSLTPLHTSCHLLSDSSAAIKPSLMVQLSRPLRKLKPSDMCRPVAPGNHDSKLCLTQAVRRVRLGDAEFGCESGSQGHCIANTHLFGAVLGAFRSLN